MQVAAQEAVNHGLQVASRQHVSEAALVAIEPQTGFVRALVGGTGWSEKSQFNRAWQAQRPAGSSFKIFVYSTALESGYSPDSVVADAPVDILVGPNDHWNPKNSDGRYLGNITLRTALQRSRNPVSARLVDAVGPSRVADLAYKMGIKTHVEPVMSLALGAVSVTPFDMASALAVVANGGRRVDVTLIKMIQDSDGKIIEDHRVPPSTDQILRPGTAFALTEMMENVVNYGTGYLARLRGRPAAGKTGTTDENRDAWFCGFVPQLAAAVWVGNDDDSRMYGTSGGDVPAPIWHDFMEAVLAHQPVAHFGADAQGNVTVPMCRDSGLRATALCPNVDNKSYPWDRVPQKFCSTHVFVRGADTSSKAPVASPTAEDTPVGDAPSGEDETPAPEATPVEPDTDASPGAPSPPDAGRPATPTRPVRTHDDDAPPPTEEHDDGTREAPSNATAPQPTPTDVAPSETP
jgi:membrane carboxypeptidase/penicillin-binding protein